MAEINQQRMKEAVHPVFLSDSGLVLSSLRIRRPPVEKMAEAGASLAVLPPKPERKRFSSRELDQLLRPVYKHWPNESWNENWSLYWLPATFENRASTAADPRFLKLFENLIRWTKERVEVRPFTFMDTQLTYPHLIEHFILNAIDYLPLGAMGFRPGRGPIGMPKHDEITRVDFRAAYEKLKQKQQAFRAEDMFPGMPNPQHFIFGDQDLARRNLMGRGGYTFFLSQHGQQKFAEVAGQILAEHTKDPIMEQMPLVVPLLDSQAFLTARMELLTMYFGLFDLYVAESQADKGILIAASRNLDEPLVEFIEQVGYRESKRPRGL